MTEFSIIIPAYNVYDYLEQCVVSVVGQIFNDNLYEVIIVNDGSTDDTGTLADKLSQKYSNVITIHKENGGTSSARNTGIERATGKYLLFLDGDDFWTDNDFLDQLSKTINQRQIDLVIYPYSLYYNDSKITKLTYDYRSSSNDFRTEFFDLMKLNILSNPTWNKCVRRELFTKDLLFIEGISYEDMPWNIDLYKKVKTYSILNNPQLMYRQNREGSTTNSISKTNIKDMLDGLELTLKTVSSFNDDFQEKILSYHCYNYIIILPYLAPYLDDKNIYQQAKSLSDLLKYRRYIGDISFRVTGNIVSMFGVRLGSKILSKLLPLYKKIKG